MVLKAKKGGTHLTFLDYFLLSPKTGDVGEEKKATCTV
jgi:hypothetical protein